MQYYIVYQNNYPLTEPMPEKIADTFIKRFTREFTALRKELYRP